MQEFDEQFTNMVRAGMIFARKDYNKFSSKKVEGVYLGIQEMLDTVHRGNEIDRATGLLRNINIPTVSYKEHAEHLLSKGDLSELGLPKFFDSKPYDGKVAYASYSRSGNTFFRRYLEQAGGIFTGSDGDLNYALHYSLQYCGFSGECFVDDSTWFVKTHYPLGIE